MGNMDKFKQDSERTQSPTDDDDEEDDENQEQIRLVETPDPVVFSRMENSNSKSIHSISGALRDASPNDLRKDFTTIQCQNEFYSNYIFPKEESSMTDVWPRIWKKCRSKKCSPLDWIVSLIPILFWLPKYKWKTDLAFDATAGFTVAVMNIPQGIRKRCKNHFFRKECWTYFDMTLGIAKEANTTAILLSLVTVTFLVTYNELIKPTLCKRLSFPIPIELITIIIGTLVSRYWITSSAYGISVVNEIPTGLPDAVLPPLKIVPDLILDGLIIAVVSYAISISMAKIFAQKHQYEVRPNQELIANGSSNVFGSFFSCAPIATSLSRSLIQEQVGGKTQLAGLFSCTIILFVLLWLAPFFETLPHCVLSSLIVVALKGMFLQFGDFPKAWKESRINGGIWIISFIATVFLDIEYGLLIGVIIIISSLLWKSSSFDVIEMGQHVHSHLFVEKNKPDTAIAEVPHIKILKLVGNLNFVTKDVFASKVDHILNKNQLYLQLMSTGKISALVLDFSSVSSIDPASVKSIRELHDNQEKVGVQIFYVACPTNVIGVMKQCDLFEHIKLQYFYPSIEHIISHLESAESTVKDNLSQQTEVMQNGDHFNEYFLGQ